jgi:hypothetical protein
VPDRSRRPPLTRRGLLVGGAVGAASFEAGGHDAGYWRRVLPDQLRFLGEALA